MNRQTTLTMTETVNLQIHIPMRIRRMQGRKMILASQALDGDVPLARRKSRRPSFRPCAEHFPGRKRLRVGSFIPSRIWPGVWL